MAMKSTSSRRCLAARSTIRPMRPNPLIATRTAMRPPPLRKGRTLYGKASRGGLFVEERRGLGVDAGCVVERDPEVGQEAREQARGARSGAVARAGKGQ